VRDEVWRRLVGLNSEFYQTFAEAFSETRRRVQPGVRRALEGIAATASVLDLGCGPGNLANALADHGHVGFYAGLDGSQRLLTIARQETGHPQAIFLHSALTEPSWTKHLAQQLATVQAGREVEAFRNHSSRFDRVCAFALIHHLPGAEQRLRVVRQAAGLLGEGGVMVVSVWDFLSSPRFRGRIVPWETIGLTEGDVEVGDYLLDWRRGGHGLRYVHLFSEDELAYLAQACQLRTVETYRSDGENRRMAMYALWQRQTESLDP